jgi:hypothetical protein
MTDTLKVTPTAGEIKVGTIISGLPARYSWLERMSAWLRRADLPKTTTGRIISVVTAERIEDGP